MQSTPYGRLLFIDPSCSLESAERTSTQVTCRANRKKCLTVPYIVEHPNQEGDTCIDCTSQYCWTNGWNCLWRGHSVYRNRPLIPPPPPLARWLSEVKPACGAGTGATALVDDTPQAPVSDGLHLRLPLPVQRSGSRKVGQRCPMQSLRDAHRAPVCKSCQGHRGVRQCCSRH